jgi:RNA polymerase sigma-70 factor (ECF subfamily)
MVRSREFHAAMAGDAPEAAADAAYLDEAGFARLHAALARPLWSYLYRVVGDATQAEDLVQDTFLRLLKARIGGLGDEERRAYAFRVAGNLAMDAFRKGRREGEMRDIVQHEQPRETAPQAHDLDVARSFGQLAPRERAMLWLAYVEGSGHEEIAQSLGVRTGSMKVLLFRARRKLRDLLSKERRGEGEAR